jgi:hypothetical protein
MAEGRQRGSGSAGLRRRLSHDAALPGWRSIKASRQPAAAPASTQRKSIDLSMEERNNCNV